MPEENKRITMTTRKGGRTEVEPSPKAAASRKTQAETAKKGKDDADNA